MVPADTRISIEYTTSKEDRCVYLVLRTNNATRIKAAVTFAERLFDGESFVVHEKEPTAELRIPLRPPKDVAATLSIKAPAAPLTMLTPHQAAPLTALPHPHTPPPRLPRPSRVPPPSPPRATTSSSSASSCPSSPCTWPYG